MTSIISRLRNALALWLTRAWKFAELRLQVLMVDIQVLQADKVCRRRVSGLIRVLGFGSWKACRFISSWIVAAFRWALVIIAA